MKDFRAELLRLEKYSGKKFNLNQCFTVAKIVGNYTPEMFAEFIDIRIKNNQSELPTTQEIKRGLAALSHRISNSINPKTKPSVTAVRRLTQSIRSLCEDEIDPQTFKKKSAEILKGDDRLWPRNHQKN